MTSSSPDPSTQCSGNMANSGSSRRCVSTRKTSAVPSASSAASRRTSAGTILSYRGL